MEQAEPIKQKELPEGTVDDFIKMDIRVGELKEVWCHPESENLYCEKIDIGESELRQIGSGLQKFVPIEEMKGKVLVLANLKPRKLAGFNSNGMIMCASTEDHSQVELLRPPQDAVVGERVSLEDLENLPQEYQKLINPKHKVLEKVLPLMKTNDELYACFNGKKLVCSTGMIQSQTLKNANIS